MRALLNATLLAVSLQAGGAHAAEPAIQLSGDGVQIYTCLAGAAGPAWHLTGPEASLTDASGRIVGRHFAGPSWQATDGSTVVGAVVTASAAPSPGSISWLVLRAVSHDGAGRFGHVASIIRLDTQGGVAPPTGCDAAHLNGEQRVPYHATYVLFPSD